MVDDPTMVVNVLPALSVPVENKVSVEMGVEPPLPPAPPVVKMVFVLTAVVMVLPALFVPVEKTVSVEIAEDEPPLPAPEPEALEPPAPPPVPVAVEGPPVAVKAEVAARVPTELPALDADEAAPEQY